MPVTVDAGDTSQGLRRAFGLTGRIPLALDETAVPTALTRDASSPPYASEPRYCMASAICQGTAGTFGTLTIENNTFKVGDNAAGVVAVIDNVEFSTQEGATRQHQIWLARRSINLGLSLVVPTVVGNDDQQGTGSAPQGARCQVFNDPAAAGAPGVLIWNHFINASRQPYRVELGKGVVLYNNDILIATEAVAAANFTLITIRWREYIIRAT